MSDLEELIVLRRKIISLHLPGHPDRSTDLSHLAVALRNRFMALGDVEDLANAVTHLREAVLLCSPENASRAGILSNLGSILSNCFDKLGRKEDLEDAITCLRKSLLLCPAGHRAITVTHLAQAIHTRYHQFGVIDDLSEAIMYAHEALALRPPGDSDRPFSLNNLALYLCTRFEQFSTMEDLELAIKYQRESVDLCLPVDPHRPRYLNNLALCMYTRFSQRGGIDDIVEAIEYSREALALQPLRDFSRPFSLNNLALYLSARFQQSGKMEDLKEAIDYNHKALDACPPGDTRRGSVLNNLAQIINTRFQQLGSIADLDEAIKYSREALLISPPGNSSHLESVNNLGIFLSTRFKQSGKVEDLENAIDYYRNVVDAYPSRVPKRGLALGNLAGVIHTRYEKFGGTTDLDEAIKYNGEALLLLPSGHPKRYACLSSLAAVLLDRYQRDGQAEDMAHVSAYMREGLDLCPPGNTWRDTALSNLAVFLRQHFQQLGGIADLDNAITYDEEALHLRPHGHPERWTSLNHLALGLSTRFEELHRVDDLRNAIAYHSQAETTLHSDHPEHVELGRCIASTYLLQYRTNHTLEHLTMAFENLERAANHRSAGSKAQFEAALEWVSLARQYQHYSELRAYSRSLTALDRCLATRLSIESQQQFIAKTPKSLTLDAAACAIANGELESAVELLEQGRAIVWARLRGYRHSLEKLHEVDSELAQEFQMLSAQLEQQATSSDFGMKVSEAVFEPAGLPVSMERKMKQHRILSEKWDGVVSQIRRKEGFADFLLPIPFTTLQKAAKEGPVIIVNISKGRSDAIILCRDSRTPILVPLPNALPKNLAHLSTQLLEAQARDALDFPKTVYGVLRTLWEVVVLPVRIKLAELNLAERTRIWWCPTSKLCGLPLHAAGPYSQKQKNFPDIYVSSYTPSLSALISARADIARPPTTICKMLVIGQPSTLPQVNNEIFAIQKFQNSLTILSEENATSEAVLSSLMRHSWAHFACHGIQDVKPYKSSFILHDDTRLTLLELIKARLPDAEFAFLSACHSAAGDLRGTPDEIIHLAAALQFCGFRSVVGTLWAMSDLDAPNMARDFYKYMFPRPERADFRDAAIALNRATRQMRGRGVPVDRWVNFVHIGA
jgi:tetratricopeptide (TPR) repeat protein